MPTSNLCLRRVTALTPLTTVLLLQFPASLKLLKQSLTRTFLSICHLSILFLTTKYVFRKGRSTGDLFAFLTDSWSSSLSCFGETFAVALDISKTFYRVWHKALLSKLPSYGFYPALCSFLSRFLSGRSIAAEVDEHCSNPKPINSRVPQGSVLPPTLFLLFNNDLLSLTNCPFHSYADDTTLHYSTSFDRHPNLQELQISRNDAGERSTLDLSTICDWGRRNLISLNASKTQFLHLLTRENLPHNYSLFFKNTPTLYSLGLSFTTKLNWKFHISSLAKSASSWLGVQYRFQQFSSLYQLLTKYRGLVRPCMEYACHVLGGSTHTALLGRVESKAFSLISSPPLTSCLLFL